MRMLPSRYLKPQPFKVKPGEIARIKHISAPLKGLSLSSKLVEGDPLIAPILDNFIVDENLVKCRGGIKLLWSYSDPTKPVWCLIPYHGGISKQVAAIDHKLVNLAGTVLQSGFTSDDWHWTGFSNLSQTEYTILVNGKDGVWSWDGADTSTTPAAVAVTGVSKTNPAVVTVASADIGKFINGTVVVMAGATGTGWINVNGPHYIYNVGVVANSFTLVGVDCTTATGTMPAGITATPSGTGCVKEAVTAPATSPHINPDQFQIVVSHMNRLWFADNSSLALYYLPLQQKAGEVKELPLNAVFRRGGSVRAVFTWTTDGGMGQDDRIVVFSTNAEAAVYGGTDPDTDMQLIGVYRFDSPLSKHCVINYGGDLYCMISTGLVPFSTLVRAEVEQLGDYDRQVYSEFSAQARAWRNLPGWQVMLNHTSGRAFCNMPLGAPNMYKQMVRLMTNPAWTSWSGLPARCWGWLNNRMYLGSDDGKVYEQGPDYLNDNGLPIKVDIQAAWSSYGTPTVKHFRMVRPYIITDGAPRPYVDMRVDYDTTPPQNQPDVTEGDPGSAWDVSPWADEVPPQETYWTAAARNQNNWTGVGSLGNVGAPRLTAAITNCKFALAGWDVIYEQGSALG